MNATAADAAIVWTEGRIRAWSHYCHPQPTVTHHNNSATKGHMIGQLEQAFESNFGV